MVKMVVKDMLLKNYSKEIFMAQVQSRFWILDLGFPDRRYRFALSINKKSSTQKLTTAEYLKSKIRNPNC